MYSLQRWSCLLFILELLRLVSSSYVDQQQQPLRPAMNDVPKRVAIVGEYPEVSQFFVR